VRKALSWSAEFSNPVQSEYIVMKKADGILLVDVWGDMNPLQQFSLIKNSVRLEAELASLEIPACGDLYFRGSLKQALGKYATSVDDICV
jgi:hypothetical protein